ncbi:MAG: hypothetical protein IIW01_09550, partial [Thermoguttaceae bacterium]|nr:hypothetical protein [Thermoguttaceae bacterium]
VFLQQFFCSVEGGIQDLAHFVVDLCSQLFGVVLTGTVVAAQETRSYSKIQTSKSAPSGQRGDSRRTSRRRRIARFNVEIRTFAVSSER